MGEVRIRDKRAKTREIVSFPSVLCHGVRKKIIMKENTIGK